MPNVCQYNGNKMVLAFQIWLVMSSGFFFFFLNENLKEDQKEP